MGQFQFAVLSSLRVAQLVRGCVPRVDGLHKKTVLAQLEVFEGKVAESLHDPLALQARVEFGELEPVHHG